VYWLLTREAGAYEISIIFGFTYMTASIIQSDLAARACSLDAAGTIYALFMSICNFGSALSTWIGAYMYDMIKASWSAEDAFRLLIIMNGVFTASCWLVVRYLPEDLLGRPVEAPGPESPPLAEATVAG
jgi:MFS family permease